MPDMADMEEKVFNLNSKLTRRLWVLFFRLINAVNAQPESVCEALLLQSGASPGSALGVLSWASKSPPASPTPSVSQNDLVYP